MHWVLEYCCSCTCIYILLINDPGWEDSGRDVRSFVSWAGAAVARLRGHDKRLGCISPSHAPRFRTTNAGYKRIDYYYGGTQLIGPNIVSKNKWLKT